jgi:hypothetical protein
MERASTICGTLFAVRRLVLWQAQGIDIDQAMLGLSPTRHAKISNTYWQSHGRSGVDDSAGGKSERFAAQPGAGDE